LGIPYQALLAAHLLAVALFLAGLFATGALLPGLTRPDELRRLLRFNRFVITPAIVLVWAFGGAMAIEAGWFASGWLQAKLVFVVLLTAWHGRQSRTLRRASTGRAVARTRRVALPILLGLVVAIVTLAAAKPF
jgi:putative membrane protein